MGILGVARARLAICSVLIYFHPEHISNKFYQPAKVENFFLQEPRAQRGACRPKNAIYLIFEPFFTRFGRLLSVKFFWKQEIVVSS